MHSVDELLAVVVREQDDDRRWTAIQELHALGTREVFDDLRPVLDRWAKESGWQCCRSTSNVVSACGFT